MGEVRRRAERGAAEVHISVEVKVGERQPIRNPHSSKVEILILKFSLKRGLEIRTLLLAGKVKHTVSLAFVSFVEGFSGARGTHPLFAVANKTGFGFRCG